ncbi:ComF family protein [Nitrincola sp.]|uniref:ComF family protein n=1 Tax=Nitrincola sp. TaxID=1926584 RepID=UPI003A939A8A
MFFDKVNYRLLFKQTCSLCQLQTAQINGLCEDCHADLPWLLLGCPVCGLPRSFPDQTCSHCQQAIPRFDRCEAPLEYRFPINSLLPGIKYHGRIQALGWLAELLSHHLQDRCETWPDLLLPVPMHPIDEALRGFNQAELLANLLSQKLQIRCDSGQLRKAHRRVKQMTLSASARRNNLKGAFSIRGELPQSVALIDDIMTTGATADEIAGLLKNQGVSHVQVWVLARTPEPDLD